MDQCQSENTLMNAAISLNQDLNGKTNNQTSYIGMIYSSIHLTSSLQDIMYSVCLCKRF